MNLGRSRRHIRFALPQVVAWDSFEAVLATLAKESGDESLELDFSKVLHLHYAALGRFAERLRGLSRGFQPIAMTGLDPYVLQIVEFALSEKDWDLFFVEMMEEPEAESPGGNRISRAAVLPGERTFESETGPFLGLWSPCPN